MNIPKAIKILERAANQEPVIPFGDLAIADRLGIEALTLYNRCRNTQPVWLPLLLPGETKD